MDVKSAAKVGLVVILALVLGIGLYLWLSHLKKDSYQITALFDDTKGLNKNSTVRLAGVNIGEVADVILDTRHYPPKPVVLLAIERKYDIPQNADFVIGSGILITTAQIEIRPRPDTDANTPFLAKDGPKDQYGSTATVTGAPSTGGVLSGISPELAAIVKNLNNTVVNINGKLNTLSGKLGKVLDNANGLMATSQKTIGSANNIIGDPQLKLKLLATVENFRQTSKQASISAKELSGQFSDLVSTGKGEFGKLSKATTDLIVNLSRTITDAQEIVKKLTEQVSDPRLQQSLQETLELATATLASARQIASDIHQITGDPTLSRNFSQTVSNFNSASGKANDILDKLNGLLGKASSAVSKVRKPTLPKIGYQINVSEGFDPAQFRLDADARLHLGRRNTLDLGLYDLGGTTRLDLEGGRYLSDQLLARYGIYASKLGVGMDYLTGKPVGFRLDLYDPNHPRLDGRVLFRVNKNASIWVGGDSLFKDPTARLGIQFKD